MALRFFKTDFTVVWLCSVFDTTLQHVCGYGWSFFNGLFFYANELALFIYWVQQNGVPKIFLQISPQSLGISKPNFTDIFSRPIRT